MFSFYELLARPDLMEGMKPPPSPSADARQSNGIMDSLLRPLLSPRPKSRTSSSKSLDSTGREGPGNHKTDKTSSVCSSDSLNHAMSESSLESSSVEVEPDQGGLSCSCTLQEFLLEPPPPKTLATDHLTRTSSLFSLYSIPTEKRTIFSSSQTKKPLYRSRAKSDEDLFREYSLVEFLSSPHLNPAKQSGGIFSGFNFTKSLRQLSQGSVSFEKAMTVGEMLTLRRVSFYFSIRFYFMICCITSSHLVCSPFLNSH